MKASIKEKRQKYKYLPFLYTGFQIFQGERKIFCVYGKNSSLIRNRYV